MAEVLAQVHEQPSNQVASPQTSPSANDSYVVKALGSDDIRLSRLRVFPTDYTGESIACYFHAAGRMVGVDGNAHKTLPDMVDRIAKEKEYRDRLSREFIYGAAIDWLQASANANSEVPESFTRLLIQRAASSIGEREFWFPIPVLQVDVEFAIGPTIFRRVSKAMMDDLAATSHADRAPEQQFAFNRQRAKLQSAGAACIRVNAEPIRARQLAEEATELSIAMLRLACPAILNAYQ